VVGNALCCIQVSLGKLDKTIRPKPKFRRLGLVQRSGSAHRVSDADIAAPFRWHKCYFHGVIKFSPMGEIVVWPTEQPTVLWVHRLAAISVACINLVLNQVSSLANGHRGIRALSTRPSFDASVCVSRAVRMARSKARMRTPKRTKQAYQPFFVDFNNKAPQHDVTLCRAKSSGQNGLSSRP